jgi:hypothetical protein
MAMNGQAQDVIELQKHAAEHQADGNELFESLHGAGTTPGPNIQPVYVTGIRFWLISTWYCSQSHCPGST